MSVATQHSPFAVGSKRLYESEENEDHLQRLDSTAATHKRYRHPHQQHLRGSPPGRCGSGGEGAHQHAAYTVGLATVAALRALFPEMSDKVSSPPAPHAGADAGFLWPCHRFQPSDSKATPAHTHASCSLLPPCPFSR